MNVYFFGNMEFIVYVSCLKIDTGEDEADSEGSDSECDGTLDLSKITEMRLVPSDPSQCMFWLCPHRFKFIWSSYVLSSHFSGTCLLWYFNNLLDFYYDSGNSVRGILWMR